MCSLIVVQPIRLICPGIPQAGWRFCLSTPRNLISREGKSVLVVWSQRHVAVSLLTRVAPVQMLFWTSESAHCSLLWQFSRYMPILFLCNKVTFLVHSYLCGLDSSMISFLRFPLPPIPPTATHSSSSTIPGWYNRPKCGRRTKWTQSHPTPRN
jgi:hypothetical protein